MPKQENFQYLKKLMGDPAYDSEDCLIYQGDCRDLLAKIHDPKMIDLLLTDPPYGIGLHTDYANRGRGIGMKIGSKIYRTDTPRGRLTQARNFKPIIGDGEPFDPDHLLRFPRLILFGGNFYADKLPISGGWIVWDKLDGLTSKRAEEDKLGFCDNPDAELAWTNLGGSVRIVRHRWMGLLKGSERQENRQHPTQKPVFLMTRLILAYTEPGDIVLDPYMGSGSVLVACRQTGRLGIGIDLEPEYVEVGARRLEQLGLGLHIGQEDWQ